MDLNRFPYLEMYPEEREVRYMGYRLPLTVGEYQVLKAVLSAEPLADKNAVKEITDADVTSDGKISLASIPVHIFSINKKAVTANGRKIVEFKKKIGYFINKNM